MAVAGSYALHRHKVGLDEPKDSYTGRQIFYNPYVNSREFGIRIWPGADGYGLCLVQRVKNLRLRHICAAVSLAYSNLGNLI